MKDKRILFVTDTFGYGGAEKQLAFVVEGLLYRGYSVAICNLDSLRCGDGKRKVDSRIELYEASITYRNAIRTNFSYIKFTRNAALHFNPDVIIGFKELANFCSVIVGRIIGIPSIISERADPYRAYSHASFFTRIKLWFINRASGGVFQTDQAASFYREKLRLNSTIIPNPIFVKEEIPEKDYSNLPKTIVSLGRLDNKQKRLDVLLDAFALFHSYHSDYVLKIYGNGEDEELVRQWINEKGLNGKVLMKGISTDPIRDLSREGIFLITSDFEGISNSLLEAMACGMPVVSTDHTPGGARLLIQDGENGLLVPIGDVDAISKALGLYAEDKSLAERCGKNAKKVLDRFSPGRTLDKWENYIVSMCK